MRLEDLIAQLINKDLEKDMRVRIFVKEARHMADKKKLETLLTLLATSKDDKFRHFIITIGTMLTSHMDDKGELEQTGILMVAREANKRLDRLQEMNGNIKNLNRAIEAAKKNLELELVGAYVKIERMEKGKVFMSNKYNALAEIIGIKKIPDLKKEYEEVKKIVSDNQKLITDTITKLTRPKIKKTTKKKEE